MSRKLSRRGFLTGSAALLAGSAAVPLLSSCGSSASAKATEIKALLITGGALYPRYWQKITSDFKKQTGITVNYDLLEFTPMTTKEITLATARSPLYDVYSTHTAQIGAFFSTFEPLNKYFSHTELNDFFPGPLKALTNPTNGDLAAIPRNVDARTQYYRTDLFKAAGAQPAKTWDELATVSGKLTKGGHYGLVLAGQGDPGQRQFTDFLWQAGGDWLDESNNVAFNSPQGVEALTFYTDLVRQYKVTPSSVDTYQWDENTAQFANGVCATVFDWPGLYADYSDPSLSKVSGSFSTAQLPSHKTAISNAISHAMAVNKYSSKKSAAVEFVKFTVGREALLLGYQQFANYPSQRSIADEVTKNSQGGKKQWLEALGTTIEQGKEWPSGVPGFNEVSTTVQSAIESALSGQMSPKAALDSAAQQSTQILKNSGAIH
jgi:multiple sugar transport system substrate-binding protein